ncbi:MAG: carboxypeptidase regulatory-like domain-containing protein, partial [Kineosporiaceae bacterium]|nr:carboxypeptidase regulatory-like domain-containing protein [Aeromicrobium sp.]
MPFTPGQPDSARRRLSIFLAVLIAVTAGLTVGGSATISASAAGTATISGTVTGDGSPPVSLEGASVEAIAANGSFVASSSTDASGNYSIGGLDAGSYTLQFRAPYGANFVSQYWGNKLTQQSADYFTVASGETLSGKNALLAVGASIGGNVSGGGAPLTGANVYAYTVDGNWAGGATTDAAGNYSLSGVAAGSFTLQFVAANGANFVSQYWANRATLQTADYFTVSPGQTVTGKDAVLVSGASISGNVKGQGSPNVNLSGVYVSAYSTDRSTSAYTTTDSNGNYSLVGLAASSVTIRYSAASDQNYVAQYWNNKPTEESADRITVTTGQAVAGKDVVLLVGASINGNVQGKALTNIPLAGASVSAYAPNGSFIASATTNTDGNYSITGLAAGSYGVQISPAPGANFVTQYWNGKPSLAASDHIGVTAGEAVFGKNALLEAGGTISGNLKGEGSPNVGLANASIRVYSANQNVNGYDSTDANGDYHIVGLPAGSYTLQFSAPYRSNFASEYWNGKSTSSASDAIVLTAGQSVIGKDAVLAVGATISGNVKGEGSPNLNLPNVSVSAFASDGSWYGSDNTDALGNYTILGLGAADYTLQFSSSGTTDYVSQYWNGKSIGGQPDHIIVTAGQTVLGKDALLKLGGSVTGKVMGRGVPNENVSNVFVYASMLDGSWGGSAVTDSDGNYSLRGLAPASYTLFFNPGPGSNFVRQYWSNKSTPETADAIAVISGQVSSGKNVLLEQGASIGGNVQGQGSTNTNLSNASVYAMSTDGVWFSAGMTDDAGNYTIVGLPAGSYILQFVAPSGANY